MIGKPLPPLLLLLDLPHCSPDFDPIEMAFAKLKALRRKAATRTVPDLCAAIAATLDAFTLRPNAQTTSSSWK